MSIIIMPFFGKWFGRQWAYWGESSLDMWCNADSSFCEISEVWRADKIVLCHEIGVSWTIGYVGRSLLHNLHNANFTV
jgi:hypothetical protein